jgi:hypothetical protein
MYFLDDKFMLYYMRLKKEEKSMVVSPEVPLKVVTFPMLKKLKVRQRFVWLYRLSVRGRLRELLRTRW